MSVIIYYFVKLGFTNTECSQSIAGISADNWSKQDFNFHNRKTPESEFAI